jgi:hypothetical protein
MVTDNKLTTATARGARRALGILLGAAALVMSSLTSASAQYVPWIYGSDVAYHFGGYHGPDPKWVTGGPNYYGSYASSNYSGLYASANYYGSYPSHRGRRKHRG